MIWYCVGDRKMTNCTKIETEGPWMACESIMVVVRLLIITDNPFRKSM